MTTIKLIAALGLTAAIAACAPQPDLSPNFGNAVQHNMAVHIINPSPSYSNAQQVPALDGPRSAGAQERYDTGKIIKPERLRTTGDGTSASR